MALQPSQPKSNYFCTDEAGAKRLDAQAKENADCHAQLKTVSSTTDWSTVIIVGVITLFAGVFIGQAAK